MISLYYIQCILCVTLFVTSSLAVFEAAIWVKSTHLIKSCLKTRKNGNNFLNINLHLKDRLDIEFTACSSELMASFTISDASLRVRRIVIEVRKYVTHRISNIN